MSLGKMMLSSNKNKRDFDYHSHYLTIWFDSNDKEVRSNSSPYGSYLFQTDTGQY